MKKIKHIIIFLFSSSLVFSTVFIQQKSLSIYEKNVIFGYPVGFVVQNFEKENTFDYYQSFKFDNLILGSEMLLDKFLLSVLLVFLFVELFIYILEYIYFKMRKKYFNEN